MRAGLVVLLAAATLVLALAGTGRDTLARLGLAMGMPELAARLSADPRLKGYAELLAGDPEAAAATLDGQMDVVSLYNRAEALARTGRVEEAVWHYDRALDSQRLTRSLAADASANRQLILALLARDPLAGGNAGTNAAAVGEKDRSLGDANDGGSEDATSGAGRAGDRESSAEAEAPGGSKVARVGLSRQGKESGMGEAKGSAGDAGGSGRTGGQAFAAEIAATSLVQQSVLRRNESRSVPATRKWLKTMADDPGAFLKLQIIAEQERRKRAGTAAAPMADTW